MPTNPDSELVETVVSLIHEAGVPYFDWFFGDAEAARTTLKEWLARPSSEVAAERVSLVYRGGTSPAGLFVALSGTELQSCRKSDLLALIGATSDPTARRALMERLAQTHDLFARVGTEEYYLSKMAVVPDRRGTGMGRHVLEEFIAAGEEQGHDRFSLDVAAENAPALNLYESAGFRRQEVREGAGMRYVRMALNRVSLIAWPALHLLETVPAF